MDAPSPDVLAERIECKDELQRERILHVKELFDLQLNLEAKALTLAAENHNKSLAMWLAIGIAAMSLLGNAVVILKH